MKSTIDWYENGNGTNNFGFLGLPGGSQGVDGFFGKEMFGEFWSSTTKKYFDVNSPTCYQLVFYDDFIEIDSKIGIEGLSVRCIKD